MQTPKDQSIPAKLTKIISIRHIVQICIATILIIAGWNFYHFVNFIRGIGPEAVRPPVAESFLPIAGIIAFKVYLFNGFFDTVHPAGLTIFIATIVTAFVFRRALCSWICPIGALSEQLGRLGKKVFGKNVSIPKWLDRGLLTLKYLILAAICWIFLSMTGKEAIAFMQSPFYAASDIRMFEMFANLSAIGFFVFLFLTLMSIPIKSFWCRYLCPYGALLGVLGLISPILLKKNDKTCTHCGSCNRACVNRVNIKDSKDTVVTTECIGCTSCVEACPKKGTLQFKLFGKIPVSPLTFSIAFLSIFFAAIIIAKLTGHWDTALTVEKYRVLDSIMSAGRGSVGSGGF